MPHYTQREEALADRRKDMLLCAIFRPTLFISRLARGYYAKETYVARYTEQKRRR